ncbi:hypothetical protein [Hymenobacter sp. UYP22]|uniref:hypothetical protein n=1 Tax=Hymenobacter sp. UYP22 TaxID=3156348 RepID=UPI003399F632
MPNLFSLRPLLLLGDITGLLWFGGLVLLAVFLGFVAVLIRAGKRNFVARAGTPAGQERRLTLLWLLAPVMALFLLYALLVG